jgi:hypothetical protein
MWRTIVAIVLAVIVWPILVVIGREATRTVQYGGPTGGYIGAYNFGTLIFDTGLVLILLAIAWWLGRKSFANDHVKVVVLGAFAIAIGLGIYAAVSAPPIRREILIRP